MHRRARLPLIVALLFPAALPAVEPEANVWVKSDAVIEGRRRDVPVGYDPATKRFTVPGGRNSWGDYKKPRSYDV